jgi:NADH dehydrogenase FAD-containing subunit
VEEDYLDRANVDILRGSIKSIDVEKREMIIAGLRKPVKFDKILVAWGSDREKLS